MRSLEVLGLTDDGATLLCQDAATGESFSLPCDDRLKAAARGDLSRLGQLEIELESQLRPKDIQTRIRGGASVAEVAALAGTSTAKVERYAYPVLMERTTMTQRASQAQFTAEHDPTPARPRTVRETVSDILRARGHGGSVQWDAYKEQRDWVLTVSWKAGRSDNRATFTFHPGPGVGTVIPRNDSARDLLAREPQPLRTVSPAVVAGQLEIPAPGEPTDIAATQRIPRVSEPKRGVDRVTAEADAVAAALAEAQGESPADEASKDVADDRSGAAGVTEHQAHSRTGTEDAAPAKKHGRAAKPAMPSWDDVLLGGRKRR